jgi:hypothetical protein
MRDLGERGCKRQPCLNEGAQREAMRELVCNLLMSKSDSKRFVGSCVHVPPDSR